MRWIYPLLIAAGGLSAQDGLDSARVSLSYKELRTLIEAARPQPTPAPAAAIPSAILGVEYDLAIKGSAAEGTATYLVENFTDEPQVIPLIGERARIAGIEPADAVLITRDNMYSLVLDKRTRLKVTLSLALPLQREEDGHATNLDLAPCPLSRLKLTQIPADLTASVNTEARPNPEKGAAVWELGSTKTLRITMTKTDSPKPVAEVITGPRVERPAIVRAARSDMRVVRDGSYMNTTSWTVRHDGPLNWTLTMPEHCQLLSCQVGGETVAPIQKNDRTWVIPLSMPKHRSETVVELSYTGREAAFQPVRGEFVGTLPATTLLVERLEWQLQIPQPYEVVAIEGNVDFLPDAKNGELRLTRELGRGDAANVHVFYQKPETTK